MTSRPVRAVLDWLSERTRVTPTEWALGIEARVRALLSEGEAADGSTASRSSGWAGPGSAPSWPAPTCSTGSGCAAQGRRVDAREQLRTAHDMLAAMGMEAFAERARRELRATGETARKRTVADAPRGHEALTAQEAQVARLARDGLSNPEIGARLFISPRTVQYHLSKVFTKLGISSRSQLDRVLPTDRTLPGHASASAG